MVGESKPVLHMRYTRLHSEGVRLWAEGIATIRLDSVRNGQKSNLPRECSLVGDIDGDQMEDVIMSCGFELPTETRLYLTTGRTLTSVQSESPALPSIQLSPNGWVLPAELCHEVTIKRAAIYNVAGALVAMSDVSLINGDSMLINLVALPIGLHFAVIGSCVVRLF